MSTIVELVAENVKRLKAVEIHPGGAGAVVIGGRNEAGKSSILDAIEMACRGERAIPEEPIRQGEAKARVVLKTDDGLEVTRTFTAKGSALVVKANGEKQGSPQAILDRLISRVALDPVAFLRLKPDEQRAELERVAGVDFADLDVRHRKAYDERTEANRERKRLEGVLRASPTLEGPTPEPVSVAELAAELDKRRKANAARASLEGALDNLRREAVRKASEVEGLEKELADSRRHLEEIRTEGKALAARLAESSLANEAEVLESIKSAEAINARARAETERKRITTSLAAADAQAALLGAELDAVEAERKARLAAAKLPVEGLELSAERGILVRGVPFAQCSQAQRLRLAVAVAMASNPTLRVVCIRDGSLLDAEALEAVRAMAVEAGAQVWVERVGSGPECGIVIEDGAVAEVRE